jgi:hypothetical protein
VQHGSGNFSQAVCSRASQALWSPARPRTSWEGCGPSRSACNLPSVAAIGGSPACRGGEHVGELQHLCLRPPSALIVCTQGRASLLDSSGHAFRCWREMLDAAPRPTAYPPLLKWSCKRLSRRCGFVGACHLVGRWHSAPTLHVSVYQKRVRICVGSTRQAPHHSWAGDGTTIRSQLSRLDRC